MIARTMLKTAMGYLACEMQSTEDKRAERATECFLQIVFSQTRLGEQMQRMQDFLLEYVLNSLLYLI